MNGRQRWEQDATLLGWKMPPVPRWKRLPLIRHVRWFFHVFNVRRHEALVRQMGLGISTGYDQWVLYGILIGEG